MCCQLCWWHWSVSSGRPGYYRRRSWLRSHSNRWVQLEVNVWTNEQRQLQQRVGERQSSWRPLNTNLWRSLKMGTREVVPYLILYKDCAFRLPVNDGRSNNFIGVPLRSRHCPLVMWFGPFSMRSVSHDLLPVSFQYTDKDDMVSCVREFAINRYPRSSWQDIGSNLSMNSKNRSTA